MFTIGLDQSLDRCKILVVSLQPGIYLGLGSVRDTSTDQVGCVSQVGRGEQFHEDHHKDLPLPS